MSNKRSSSESLGRSPRGGESGKVFVRSSDIAALEALAIINRKERVQERTALDSVPSSKVTKRENKLRELIAHKRVPEDAMINHATGKIIDFSGRDWGSID